MLNKAAEIILEQAERMLALKNRIIIAIDGRCASGKTTLASLLSEKTDCNIIHLDDFFLRPEQRTKERFSEAGGNIDYERFEEEVLIPLKGGKDFSFRPFDCGTMTLSAPVNIAQKQITIIEGSYSCHPVLKKYYDLCVFMATLPDKQQKRLLKRNPALVERFREEWIPMEERYFEAFEIEKGCDMKFET